ncbi:cysteine-rich DPF motif domain-containing protein 1 isoform X4 [Rhineura floridana]|uniref:cysteine-rich DPF motif domain-containing protein 1 isoform X4 n=1 Tax=Rhineura floridana TaxID=261503 RepID=UPI002AC8281B|nr:cysteine-rich DPF motif domain-containing protein 1 isoform X4 [Rhineura floridana]
MVDIMNDEVLGCLKLQSKDQLTDKKLPWRIKSNIEISTIKVCMRRCSPCGPLWTSSESAECLHLHALQVFQASLFLAFGLWHSQMESNKERQRQGTFECELCGLTAPYSYYGRKPPNASSVVLLPFACVLAHAWESVSDGRQESNPDVATGTVVCLAEIS